MREDKSEDRDLEQEKRLAENVRPKKLDPEEYMSMLGEVTQHLFQQFKQSPPPSFPSRPPKLPFFIRYGPSVSFACDIIETVAIVLIALFLAIGVFR